MHKLSYNFLILLLIAAALYLFNHSQPPHKSAFQTEYEKWFSELSPVLLSADEKTEIPKISITLRDLDSNKHWQLNTGSEADTKKKISPAKLQRVLQLIKEAELFDLDNKNEILEHDYNSARYELAIKAPEKSFIAKVPLKLFRSSIKLKNLFTLYRLYANEAAKPADVALADSKVKTEKES